MPLDLNSAVPLAGQQPQQGNQNQPQPQAGGLDLSTAVPLKQNKPAAQTQEQNTPTTTPWWRVDNPGVLGGAWNAAVQFGTHAAPYHEVAKTVHKLFTDPAELVSDLYHSTAPTNTQPTSSLPIAGYNGILGALDTFGRDPSTMGAIKGAGTAIRQSVPLFGAPIEDAGVQGSQGIKDIANGRIASGASNIASAAGTLTNLLAPEVPGKVTSKVLSKAGDAAKSLIPPVARPLSQAATDMADKLGLHLNIGDTTGNRFVQQIGKGIEHTFGGISTMITPHVENALKLRDQVENWIQGTTPQDFSDTAKQVLIGKHKDFGDAANTAYGRLDQIQQASSPVSVQVGTKQSSLLGPSGQPLSAPVMENIVAPVDLANAKSVLSPIKKQLDKVLTPDQKGASVGLTAINSILESPDQVSLSTADESLSRLKSILREDGVPAKTKFHVGKIIDEISPQIDSAAAKLGPAAVQSLQGGRAATAAKYRTEGIAEDIGLKRNQERQQWENNSNDFSRLTGKGTDSAQRVENLIKVAPELAEPLGQAIHYSVYSPIMTEPGSFGKIAGKPNGSSMLSAQGAWNRINSKTKDLLYSPQRQAEVEGFNEIANRLEENPNSSNSGAAINVGKIVGALQGGIGLEGLGHIMEHPIAAPAAMASSIAIPYVLAKAFNKPELFTGINNAGIKGTSLFQKTKPVTNNLRRVSGALFGPQEDQQ